jgi:hypothetical protein
MLDPDVHDYEVTGYDVDGVGRTLTLHAELPWREQIQRVSIRFEGVELHYLIGYRYGAQNVLFDVEEVDLAALVASNGVFLATEWVGFRDEAEALARLRRDGIRAWNVESSVGLSGWVLAQSCRVERH